MTPQTKKSFLSLIKGAWECTIGERGRLYLFIGLFVIAYCLDLLVPWAVGYTLGAFVSKGLTDEAFNDALLGIAAYAALRLCYALFHHFARYIQNRVAYSARMNMMSRIFDTQMRFPLRWHVSHHSGENLSKLHRSTSAVDMMIGTYIWQIIEGSVKIIFAGIALFALDFWVAFIVMTMSAATIAAMIFFNKRLTSRIRLNNAFANKLNRICVDYLSNIVTVKTLGIEKSATKHLREQKSEGLLLSQAISAFMELKWGSTSIGYALAMSLSLVVYFQSNIFSGNTYNIAQVYVLLNYLDRIFQAIGSFTGYYSGIIESSTAFEDATELFEESAKIPDRPENARIHGDWTAVNIKEINFTYVQGEKQGLNAIKFDFKRGEKVALVGHSGSGKSTLLKVFGGLIEPDSYQLSTDIHNSLSLDNLTGDCLLLPQEPEIFSETFNYNLTMGEEFDSKEIAFFISLCKLDNLLSKMARGLDTSLAEKGLNLSVGERQRIALARGLLRAGKKEILLLDEPTSSLDPKTEKEIYLGLFYHFSSRTIFSSCHRLNLIPLFDRIVLMSQGDVLEVGGFNDLIAARGHFFRMWEDYERNIRNTPSATPSTGPATTASEAVDPQ
jgi:ABC-type multidrug transport system fused ATPase/permease subunit